MMLSYSFASTTRSTDHPLERYFHMALTQKSQSRQALAKILGEELPSGDMCVLLFDLFAGQEETLSRCEEKLERSADMLLARLADGKSRFVFGEWNCCLAALVWVEYGEVGPVYRLCGDVAAALQTQLASRVQCAISACFSDYAGLPNAAEEVYEAIAFAKYIASPPQIIVQREDYHLYRTEPPDHSRPLEANIPELTKRLLRAIEDNDAAALKRLVSVCASTIIAGLPRVSAIHFSAACFCLALESTLQTAGIINAQYAGQHPLIPDLLRARNEAEFTSTLYEKLEQLMAYHLRRKYSRFADSMLAAMHYIDGHLTDPALSIHTIAEELGFSDNTLYSHFKQYYGESIPDTIHKKRISGIRQALLSTDKPIKVLAREYGYISIATLNRAFLKYEGVCPGALRSKGRCKT